MRHETLKSGSFLPVGQAGSLRADWQSAQRRLPTAAQLSKLPHILPWLFPGRRLSGKISHGCMRMHFDWKQRKLSVFLPVSPWPKLGSFLPV
jgi:hypothetical protein